MATSFRRLIQTIDSHTEGNSTRVIVGGVPVPPGKTLLERRDWLWRHDDGLRRMLNFEPRGHGMMCSVLVCRRSARVPTSPSSSWNRTNMCRCAGIV